VSIRQKDYILRMIEQLAAELARIMSLQAAGKLDEALQAVRETADGIFGPLRRTLDEVDSATAARLIGDAGKIAAYAALLAAQADILDQKGEARRARADRRRALEVYLERALLPSGPDDPTRAAITALRSRVDEGRLSERHRKALAAL
jgi:hypothetical protein